MSKVERERKENFELGKSLTKENREIFTDIVCYLRVSDLTEEDQEEIISDLLRMFLDCQEQGKSVASMVGEDYKQYTENIISAVNPHKTVYKRVQEYLPAIVGMFFVLLTIDFVFSTLPSFLQGNFDFNLPYNFTLDMVINTLMIMIIATTMVTYIGKKGFELSKIRNSRRKHYIFMLSAGGLFMLFLVTSVVLQRTLSNIVIISINIQFVIAIIVVFWIYVLVRKSIHKTISDRA